MTPKEKAKELVDIYIDVNEMYNLQNNNIVVINYNFGKQCALIAVDEIIKSWNEDLYENCGASRYWQEVKNEILKI